ncbi:MAG: Ig-like domain-containing protein [Planctomycetaceae bacterium]|jgi:hypothetical protein|nr:Ig-like domain-containing protein [Planctomycetaceae bacterium]
MKRIKMILDFSEHHNRFSVARYPIGTVIVFVFSLLLTVAAAFCQEKNDDGLWYNLGILQSFDPDEMVDEMANNVKRTIALLNLFPQSSDEKDSLKKLMEELKRTDDRIAEIQKTDWFKLLNSNQKRYVLWDERELARIFNSKNYEIGNNRDILEKRWIKRLEGPEPRFAIFSEYDRAIFGLALIKSDRAVELLLKISTEKVIKDNAHRHYATKALGILGDLSAVPEMIPLVYHSNFNTRWESQVSLVRLTGQNFGTDAEAWGKWYNENREKLASKINKELPVFDFIPIDWTLGSKDIETQISIMPEVQKKIDDLFFENLIFEKLDTSDPETPKIIKMEPENGATGVDSVTIKELRVTFDRDMQNGYSWVTHTYAGKNFFPKQPTAAKAKWIDKRTCVCPVELEPNKSYMVGINSLEHTTFRSENGVPSVPVLYLFSTAGTSQ